MSLQSSKKVLSIFSLAMITIGSVDSIRNLPSTALFGSSLIFFFLVAAIAFLIPTALMSAELSTGWPQKGGVYVWVREGLGEQWGFLAIWFQWIENVVWYPTILSFIAGTIAYLIDPALAQNPKYLFISILIMFWAITIVNLLGMKASAAFSNFCGVAGLVLPMLLIIGLGISWVALGKPLQISFSAHSLLPNLSDPTMMVSLTGVILCYCGMEIAAAHAGEAKNPQRDYPKALMISVVFIMITMIIGALAIAMVIPQAKLSLVSGVMQAFSYFLTAYHISWLLPIIGLSIIIGGLGSLNNWVIAPTKGLMVACKDLNIPYVQNENRFNSPGVLLIAQGAIVSVIALLFFVMPSINSAYWMLTALTSQLYMLMYVLMFIAGVYLRFKKPDVVRAYKIPGGKFGICLVSGIGLISCFATLFIGFYPPAGINIHNTWEYVGMMCIGLLLSTLPAVITYYIYCKKSSCLALDQAINLAG